MWRWEAGGGKWEVGDGGYLIVRKIEVHLKQPIKTFSLKLTFEFKIEFNNLVYV